MRKSILGFLQKNLTNPKTSTKSFGFLGEKMAELFLRRLGYKIIERNFRSRFGEVDLIALKDNYLVFLEVKTRWSKRYGYPEEAVTPAKIAKIKKVAEYYSLLHQNLTKNLRIEVVAIQLREGKVISQKIIPAY